MSLDLKNPRNQKLMLLGIVLIFLIYLWYSKIYTPTTEKITLKKGEYQLKVSELVEVRAQAAPLEELRQEYKELSANLQPLEELLPEEEYLVDFLKRLHNAAQLNNLLLREVIPEASTPEGEFVANDFKMELEGTYHDFGRFLAQLANFPFIVRTSKMNLRSHVGAKPKEAESEKTIVASFTITTYNASLSGS